MKTATFWRDITAGALRDTEPIPWAGPQPEPPRGPRFVMRDLEAEHQVVIGHMPGQSHTFYVSCNCLAERAPGVGGSPRYEPLATSRCFRPEEPMRIWREHMAQVGAA